MTTEPSDSQRGGVNISGSVGSVGGDIVGRDKVMGSLSEAAVCDAFQAVADCVRGMTPGTEREAMDKLEELKREAAKGKDADDSVVAKLVDGLVQLVPTAASALVSTFATPIIGGVAGPITKFVLDKLRVR